MRWPPSVPTGRVWRASRLIRLLLGLELALACDLRVMAEDATLGLPEIKLGLLPGAGGTQRLPRMLPPAIAKEMLYLGEAIAADVALRLGLVNAVVPREHVLEAALARAQRITSLPPLAIRSAKILAQIATEADLPGGLAAERQTGGIPVRHRGPARGARCAPGAPSRGVQGTLT